MIGFKYGCPFPSQEAVEPVTSTLTNGDAMDKMKKIDSACHELDLMRDVARLLDAAPVDVQERVSAWIAAKYGKPVAVTMPAPALSTRREFDWPVGTLLYAAPMGRADFGVLLGGVDDSTVGK